MIKNNQEGWESMVPTYVDNIIKEKRLFGYNNSHSKNKTGKDKPIKAIKK